jgi:large subunit ribosomal protein L17
MRHGKKLKKLGRTPEHRKSLMMNLAISLFKHERIKTTLTKAKALKPYAEKLITKARNDGGNNIHIIRQLSAMLSDKSVVQKLVGELAERFKKRPGGYTRIYKCGFRANDSAPIALIELVDYLPNKSAKEKSGIKTVEGHETKPSMKEKLTSMVKPKEAKASSEENSEVSKPKKSTSKKDSETKKSK